jgi:hypothetical protein
VIYHHSDTVPEGQCTVVTETRRGPLLGRARRARARRGMPPALWRQSWHISRSGSGPRRGRRSCRGDAACGRGAHHARAEVEVGADPEGLGRAARLRRRRDDRQGVQPQGPRGEPRRPDAAPGGGEDRRAGRRRHQHGDGAGARDPRRRRAQRHGRRERDRAQARPRPRRARWRSRRCRRCRGR